MTDAKGRAVFATRGSGFLAGGLAPRGRSTDALEGRNASRVWVLTTGQEQAGKLHTYGWTGVAENQGAISVHAVCTT
jgi:hypothetical protein